MKTTLVSLVLAGALLAGCGGGSAPSAQRGSLRVGVLNTARIVEQDPAYKDLQLNIMTEKSSFVSKLPDDSRDLPQAEIDKVQKEMQAKQKKWQEKVLTFISESVKKITDVTAEVAKQRDLDIVVINTPFTNAVHYTSGQDITLDVLLKLSKSK